MLLSRSKAIPIISPTVQVEPQDEVVVPLTFKSPFVWWAISSCLSPIPSLSAVDDLPTTPILVPPLAAADNFASMYHFPALTPNVLVQNVKELLFPETVKLPFEKELFSK